MSNGTLAGIAAAEEKAIRLFALGDVEREWKIQQARLMAALDVQEHVQATLGRPKAEQIAGLTAQLEECAVVLRYIAQQRAALDQQAEA